MITHTELDLHIAGVQIKQCDHTELDLHIAGVQIKPSFYHD